MIMDLHQKMMNVRELGDWRQFKKIIIIFNCYYFKLIISKFKINDIVTFAHETNKKIIKIKLLKFNISK